MLLLVVCIMAITIVAIFGGMSVTGQVAEQSKIEREKHLSQQVEISSYKKDEIKAKFEKNELNKNKEILSKSNHIDSKSTITDVSVVKNDDGSTMLVVSKETIKEVAPQVNNYNFENLGKVLLILCSVLATIFGIRYAIKLFKYLDTIRKFSKHEKKTNRLIENLKRTIDNQKDFLLISNDIEHQLKINDKLLNGNEAKQYGLNLEVADDYLHSEYKYINEKIIQGLQ